jgi:hypothetical protein
MDYRVLEYLLYLPISVVLTVWVARTLFHHGRPFLSDVFPGNAELAGAVNHLLVVGFYLINLGYVSLQLKLDTAPTAWAELIEALAGKVGLVLIVLGVLHFGNLYVFARIRERARHPRHGRPAPQPPMPPLPPPGAGPPYPAPLKAA